MYYEIGRVGPITGNTDKQNASHANTINWNCHFNVKEKTTPIIWSMSEMLVISGSLLPVNILMPSI